MSVSRLRRLLTDVASDGLITLAEVGALIDAAADEQELSAGERFVLQAALEAHHARFTPDALAALRRFLGAPEQG